PTLCQREHRRTVINHQAMAYPFEFGCQSSGAGSDFKNVLRLCLLDYFIDLSCLFLMHHPSPGMTETLMNVCFRNRQILIERSNALFVLCSRGTLRCNSHRLYSSS